MGIPIVIVGLRFGRRILEQLARGGPVTVVGVCDADRDLAASISREFDVQVYDDVTSICADDAVSAVGLFTGPSGRAALVRQAVRAGKHVMTTKPLEMDAHEALDVLREAREAGRVVHLNSPAPVLPGDITTILDWHTSFDLGRAVGARAETWASYQESADGSWYDDPRRCPVAPILRLGIYLINDLLALLGPAETVQVTQSRLRTGRPTSDNAQLGIAFANGALANIFASFCVEDGQSYQNSLVVNYERGTVYRRSPPGTGSELTLVRPGGIERTAVESRSGDYRWDAFARAIRGESLNGALSPEETVAGIQVLEAAARAAESGHRESITEAK